MNKKLRLFLLTMILALPALILFTTSNETEKLREQYVNHLENSPFSKSKILSKTELKKIPKRDRPDLAFQQDFLRTMDPKTGRPERKRLISLLDDSKNDNTLKANNSNLNWTSRGPLQVGGRTRALMFDPNDGTAKKVWAGGVDGGIWFNNDITDENSSWQQANVSMANFSISAMAYDPLNTQTFYVGTGEGWGNVDAVRGIGVWKTTDGGTTWTNLSSTSGFDYIYDIVVRDEGGSVGVVYLIERTVGDPNGTEVLRSTDGGVTFTTATSEPFRDLEIATDPSKTIWAGDANGNVWKSTDGTTWTKSYTAGTATDGQGYTIASPGRVAIAVSPSHPTRIYALITDGSALGEVVFTLTGGGSWLALGEPNDNNDSTVPSDDFTRGQAWYDLVAAVHPTSSLTLFLGGVNAFKLKSATTYKKISSWHSGVDNTVSFAHADHHAFIFRPGFPDQAIMGTDGGVFYIADVSTVEKSNTSIAMRNKDYVVTQFYSVAIDPIFTDGFLGGTQDNGTLYFNSPGIDDTSEFRGGDGAYCFIDQTNVDATDGLYQILSVTGNNYILHDFSADSGNGEFFISLLNTGGGSFINAADYDDENNILYSYEGNSGSTTTITKVVLAADGADQGTQAGGTTATRDDIVISEFGSTVTHIRVSPYNAANRNVFFGTINSEVARMSPDKTITIITPPTLVGSVSCIEVGASDDELLVTASNYGVTSVFYTNDGGTTWSEKEGDLPDMPVRWALFNPLNRSEVLLATEVGVWQTTDISVSSPSWTKANTGMGNVRVDMLQYRALDNTIAAATHGRGLFTSTDLVLDVEDNLIVKASKLKIFPTVSNGNITIASRINVENAKLTAFDVNGRQVYSKAMSLVNGREEAVNLPLKSGIYILSITGDGYKSSHKIIIK